VPPAYTFGGFNNVPNYANKTAFAAIKADGSIMVWGNSNNGGTNAPTDSGYLSSNWILT
jgi:hypothetical protein